MDGQELAGDESELYAPVDVEQDELDAEEEPVNKDQIYWALWKGSDLASAIGDKERAFYESARSRGIVALWVIAYAAHHGLTPEDLRDFSTQQIGFMGNELELLRFHLNLTRSYSRRSSIMALGEQAAFKAMCVNSDHKSQVRAQYADKIVNSLYKRYASKFDPKVAEADGFAGSGATHYRWDFTGGDTVTVHAPVTGEDGNPITGEDGNPITHPTRAKSGAPTVTVVYPWSMPMETRASGELQWVVVREAESKWNVAAQFPSMREAVLNTGKVVDDYNFGDLFRLDELDYEDGDLIIVKHFYHQRCAAIPEGRYAVLVGNVILWDGPCPTKEGLPVAIMKSADFIETNFGYCDGWDWLAVNQALNQVNSDELLNYANYGRQSTYSEKGTTVTSAGITKGTHWEFPAGAKPPGAVQLTAVAPTLPELKKYLHSQFDLMSDQSSTNRGDPDANVRSGEMAALLDSISLRYQSYRQNAAREFRIRGASIIVDMINRYGETPFLAEIAGIEDRAYIDEFTGEDLSGIERITMDVVSPLMQTIAGRWQVYSLLKDLPPDQRAAAYELIVTGDASLFARKDRTAEMLVRRENEDLVTGAREVFCTSGEDAVLHYQRHWAQREQLLASDDQDPEALARIDAHLQQTVQTWLSMSASVAALRGVQPPPALGPTQDNPYGNPMWQMQAQISAGASMLAAPPAGMPNAQGGPQGEQPASGPGGQQPAGGPMQPQATPGSAAQANDQGGVAQKHPSGTNLPQPSTPPG